MTAAARESAYFGSASAAAAANSFGPYAAAYAAQNMMNWNSYSLATYQGLQREGVTYGKSTTLVKIQLIAKYIGRYYRANRLFIVLKNKFRCFFNFLFEILKMRNYN